MKDSPNQLRWLTLYLVALLTLFAPRAMNPEWNFDSVMYVAVATQGKYETKADWHRAAYKTIADVAPKSALRKIEKGSRYRKQIRENPTKFETQIPFYRSKFTYVTLIRLFDTVGINPATATHVISTISVLSLGILAVFWTGLGRVTGWIICACLCLMLTTPFRMALGFSNPDPLCAALLCWGLYAIRHRRSPIWGIVFLTLSVITRADAWLMVAVIFMWLYASNGSILDRKRAIIGALVTFLGAVTVMLVSKPYSWAVVAQHTFVQKLYLPKDMDKTINVTDYLDALWKGAMGDFHMHPTALGSFLLLSLVTVGWQVNRSRKILQSTPLQLVGLAWLCAVLHFFIFPSLNDRFYIATYFIVGCESISLLLASTNQSQTS